MATEIYQSNAGYLWVEDREIPLFDTQWIHSTNNGFDYITIMNGDSVIIKNAALRHIVDNNGNGYANLSEWTAWWNSLLSNTLVNIPEANQGVVSGDFTGNPRGENAVDFQRVRVSDDQVAGSINSFIAGGARNKIANNLRRGSLAKEAHVEGFGNRVFDWQGHGEGSVNIVDGKISHAEGNNNICSANDSHVEGNRSVTGRRYYPTTTYGTEDAGDSLGILPFMLIPEIEGDVTAFFPNKLTADLVAKYGSGVQIDTMGNVYPSGMTPAVWSGETLVTENDLTWALHSICIVRGPVEGAIEFVDIMKAVYTVGVGTKVYFGVSPYVSYLGIYSSYAPTVSVAGELGGNGHHSEGYFTSTWGYGSHAEGRNTRAWGLSSHAQGESTTAIGAGSHSQGINTKAIGRSSSVSGTDAISLRDSQISHSIGKRAVEGDNQYTHFFYSATKIGVGWHDIFLLDNIENEKSYNFEAMVIGKQTAGTAGTIGDTFAYKASGLVKRSGSIYSVLGTPSVTLIGRDAGMSGDGVATGVRLNWTTAYLTDTYKAIILRMDGMADATFYVSVATRIQELG